MAAPPLRLLRHLLTRRTWRTGGRVLLVGCGGHDLCAVLDELASAVVPLERRGATAGATGATAGAGNSGIHVPVSTTVKFDVLSSAPTQPLPASEYDLVIVETLSAYASSLMGSDARQTTAALLSSLKPNGELTLVRALASNVHDLDGHGPTCWEQHFACFPGTLQYVVWESSWLGSMRWSWWQRYRPSSAYLVGTFQVPLQHLTADQWTGAVRRSALTGRQACSCTVTTGLRAPIVKAPRRAA